MADNKPSTLSAVTSGIGGFIKGALTGGVVGAIAGAAVTGALALASVVAPAAILTGAVVAIFLGEHLSAP